MGGKVHNRMVLPSAVARVLPSGLNATPASAGLVSRWLSETGLAGSATFHSQTSPVWLPAASIVPSGLYATESKEGGAGQLAEPSWAAGSVRFHSQILPLTVPARVFPPGLNAERPEAGRRLADLRRAGRVGQVPQPDSAPVVGDGQDLPVRAERHRAEVATGDGQRLANPGGPGWICKVPQPDLATAAGNRIAGDCG